jgi:hypothetical protein
LKYDLANILGRRKLEILKKLKILKIFWLEEKCISLKTQNIKKPNTQNKNPLPIDQSSPQFYS